MDISKHQSLFSFPRLTTYVNACGSDTNRAVRLYKANIQASQALYPIISVLEIALRNAIDREITKHLSDPSWLINKRTSFANHPGMVKMARGNMVPDTFFIEKLTHAENKLRYRDRTARITHGKLLAELTFGFWVKFFDTCPVRILSGKQLHAFRNYPSMNLTAVRAHLTRILELRNRISHSEPICFDTSGAICLTTLSSYENDIMSSLGWIDTDLSNWAAKINFFRPVYTRISMI